MIRKKICQSCLYVYVSACIFMHVYAHVCACVCVQKIFLLPRELNLVSNHPRGEIEYYCFAVAFRIWVPSFPMKAS